MRVPVILNRTVTITGRDNTNRTFWTLDKYTTDAHDAFFYIESLCNAWFSIEITVRFLVSKTGGGRMQCIAHPERILH